MSGSLLRRTCFGWLLAIGLLGTAGCGSSRPAAVVPGAKDAARGDLAPPAIFALVEGAAFTKVYLRDGDGTGAKDKAITKLKQALSLDSRLWEANYNLGLVYARAGQLADGVSELERAASAAPEAENVAVALCEVRRRRGDIKPAAEGLEGYCRAHPTALDARSRLVVVLREALRFDEAIAHARFLLARRPLDDGTRTELALAHLAKGERDIAELLVSQSLKGNPKSASAHRAAGLVSLAKGDDAEAFRAFEKAADLDPLDATARVNMGSVLIRAGAFKEAENAFRAVLATVPTDEGAMMGYAIALRGLKRFDDARVAYEKLLEKAPSNLQASYNLAILFADYLKDVSRARGLFKHVIDDAPKDSVMRKESERYVKEMGDGAPKPPAAPPAPATPPVGPATPTTPVGATTTVSPTPEKKP